MHMASLATTKNLPMQIYSHSITSSGWPAMFQQVVSLSKVHNSLCLQAQLHACMHFKLSNHFLQHRRCHSCTDAGVQAILNGHHGAVLLLRLNTSCSMELARVEGMLQTAACST
jgi:hypothetical protein